VGVLVLLIVGFALWRSGGEPHHLVVVRFDPRLAMAEPADTPTPRLDALRSSSALLTWTARSDALEKELDGLTARLVAKQWTVLSGNVLDAALENAARAKERGDPGPYFLSLNLAARDRAELGAAVGRLVDGLAPVLPPSQTVFVIVDPKGGSIVVHGPGVASGESDPEGDAAAVVDRIEEWAGL
jgi:hypothetical protein